MGALSGALCNVVTQLQALALPAAIIGLIIAVLGIFLVPVMGEAVASARGTVRSILVAVAFLGLLPAIVSGLAAVGGFSGSGCGSASVPLIIALNAAPPALGVATLLPACLRLHVRIAQARRAARKNGAAPALYEVE